MADSQLDYLRSDACLIDAVRRSIDSGRLVRLHHDDNCSGRGHSLAERDLHAHRYDQLPVSYTHLDVYKRQLQLITVEDRTHLGRIRNLNHLDSCRIAGDRLPRRFLVGRCHSARLLLELSLIHI